jgi:hypothetical protein
VPLLVTTACLLALAAPLHARALPTHALPALPQGAAQQVGWQAAYDDYVADRQAQDQGRRRNRAALDLVLHMRVPPMQPETVLEAAGAKRR